MDDDKAAHPTPAPVQQQEQHDDEKEDSTAPSPLLPTSDSSLKPTHAHIAHEQQEAPSPVQRPATAPTTTADPASHLSLPQLAIPHTSPSPSQQPASASREVPSRSASISGVRPAESAIAAHLQSLANPAFPFPPPPPSFVGPSFPLIANPVHGFRPLYPQQQQQQQQPLSAHAAFPPHPSPFASSPSSSMPQAEIARSASTGGALLVPTPVKDLFGRGVEGKDQGRTIHSAKGGGREVEKVEPAVGEERDTERKTRLMDLVNATVIVDGGGVGAGEETPVEAGEGEQGMVTRARGRKRSLQTASSSPPHAAATSTTSTTKVTDEIPAPEADAEAEAFLQEEPLAAPQKRRRTTTADVDPSLHQSAQRYENSHSHAQRHLFPLQPHLYPHQLHPLYPSSAQHSPSASSSASHPYPPHPSHYYPNVGYSSIAPPTAPHLPSHQSLQRFEGNLPAFFAAPYPGVMGGQAGMAFSVSQPNGQGDGDGEAGEASAEESEVEPASEMGRSRSFSADGAGQQDDEMDEVDSDGRRSATSPSTSYWQTTTSPSLSTSYQTSPSVYSSTSPILARGYGQYPYPHPHPHHQSQQPQQQYPRPSPAPVPGQAPSPGYVLHPIAPPPPNEEPLASSSFASAGNGAASTSRQVFGADIPLGAQQREDAQDQGNEEEDGGETGQQESSEKKRRKAPPKDAFTVPAIDGVKPFINKLRWLLMHPEEVGDSICWSESGNEVLLHISGDTDLADSVLPRMYSHQNLGAFYRQFTVYGFTHLKSPAQVFTALNPHLPPPPAVSTPSAASFAGITPSSLSTVAAVHPAKREPSEWRVYTHLHSKEEYEAAVLAERAQAREVRRARRRAPKVAGEGASAAEFEEESEEEEVPEEDEAEKYWFSRANQENLRLLRRVKGKSRDKGSTGTGDAGSLPSSPTKGKGGKKAAGPSSAAKGKGKGKGKKKAEQVAAAMVVEPSPSPSSSASPVLPQQLQQDPSAQSYPPPHPHHPAQYQPFAPYHPATAVSLLQNSSSTALPASYGQYQAQHPHSRTATQGATAMQGLLQQQSVRRGSTGVQGLLRAEAAVRGESEVSQDEQGAGEWAMG
ncbi:hypothetical protein JCM11251_001905 [Rhodosporidiobolus azoricus]